MPRSKAQFDVSFLGVEYHVNQLAAPRAEPLVDSQVSPSDSMVRVQVAGQEGFRGGIFSYEVSALAAMQNHEISSKQLFFVLQCAPPIPWRGQPIVKSRAQSIRSSDARCRYFRRCLVCTRFRSGSSSKNAIMRKPRRRCPPPITIASSLCPLKPQDSLPPSDAAVCRSS